jgi:hypothetical protein
MTTTATISALYRYPVKGLSAERLGSVALEAGATLPFDRAWAIENGPGRFDPTHPAHLPKINFLMLMRNERLAALECRFDEGSRRLAILRAGKPVVTGDLTTSPGRRLIEQFLAAYMQGELRGPPRIVEAPGHSFTDVDAKCVHIVSRASIADVERAVGRPVNELRFRPNIVLDGSPPWSELGWVGHELAIGGSVRLAVFKRTERCAATNVDPQTGARDMDIPAKLARRWGHTDFGIYARVVCGGQIAVGDAVTLSGPSRPAAGAA